MLSAECILVQSFRTDDIGRQCQPYNLLAVLMECFSAAVDRRHWSEGFFDVILEFCCTLPWTVELVAGNICLSFYLSFLLPILYSIVEGTLCLILFIFLKYACPVSSAICMSQSINDWNQVSFQISPKYHTYQITKHLMPTGIYVTCYSKEEHQPFFLPHHFQC